MGDGTVPGYANNYVGEIGRNACIRRKEHIVYVEKGEDTSALWRLCTRLEKHNTEQQEFRISVMGVYGNNAMLSQIVEGVQDW